MFRIKSNYLLELKNTFFNFKILNESVCKNIRVDLKKVDRKNNFKTTIKINNNK
jgi:hypothetical protein